MILSDVKDLAEELQRAGIDFVVVGGSSIERTWEVGTTDIDVAVTLKDYPKVLRQLKNHPRFRDVEDDALPIAGSKFRVGTRWVDVEFINPRPFSGRRPAEEFFDYVRRHRSQTEDGIAFANPEVVYYMRLAISDWTTYVQKIIRDTRAGVPIETLDKVLGIAKQFDNLDVLAPRIDETKRVLGLLSISPNRRIHHVATSQSRSARAKTRGRRRGRRTARRS